MNSVENPRLTAAVTAYMAYSGDVNERMRVALSAADDVARAGEISDAAVEAATRAYMDHYGDGHFNRCDAAVRASYSGWIRAALKAALPFLATQAQTSEFSDAEVERLAKVYRDAAAEGVDEPGWDSLLPVYKAAMRRGLRAVFRAAVARVRVTETTTALRDLLAEVDRNTCAHEETVRGGFIWTICQSCGRKWADDEGGFRPHQDSPVVAAARIALAAAPSAPEPPAPRDRDDATAEPIDDRTVSEDERRAVQAACETTMGREWTCSWPRCASESAHCRREADNAVRAIREYAGGFPTHGQAVASSQWDGIESTLKAALRDVGQFLSLLEAPKPQPAAEASEKEIFDAFCALWKCSEGQLCAVLRQRGLEVRKVGT